jgi:hypothetical protein
MVQSEITTRLDIDCVRVKAYFADPRAVNLHILVLPTIASVKFFNKKR